MKRNKFGVPYRRFVLRLADGRAVAMDSGCEEDWGNVQQCLPGDWPDWKTAVGWGNDAGGFSCRLSGDYDAASEGILMPQENLAGRVGWFGTQSALRAAKERVTGGALRDGRQLPSASGRGPVRGGAKLPDPLRSPLQGNGSVFRNGCG